MVQEPAQKRVRWRPKPVELPLQLRQALLTALRKSAASVQRSQKPAAKEPAQERVRWRPKPVELPSQLGQAFLTALRKSAASVQRSQKPAAKELPGEPVGESTEEHHQAAEDGGGMSASFAPGDSCWYWSLTKKKWLKTMVTSVNQEAGGDVSYNLECKSKVEPYQLRHEDEDIDGPPDTPEDSIGIFAPGTHVQCWNQEKSSWQDGTVSRQYQHGKITVYDVDCISVVLRMLPAARLRLSQFSVGDNVEYWSDTASCWLPAKVLSVRWSKQLCDLDIKRRAHLSKVRKALQAEQAEQKSTAFEPEGRQPERRAEEHDVQKQSQARKGDARNSRDIQEEDEEEEVDDEDFDDSAALEENWEDQFCEADEDGGRKRKRRYDDPNDDVPSDVKGPSAKPRGREDDRRYAQSPFQEDRGADHDGRRRGGRRPGPRDEQPRHRYDDSCDDAPSDVRVQSAKPRGREYRRYAPSLSPEDRGADHNGRWRGGRRPGPQDEQPRRRPVESRSRTRERQVAQVDDYGEASRSASDDDDDRGLLKRRKTTGYSNGPSKGSGAQRRDSPKGKGGKDKRGSDARDSRSGRYMEYRSGRSDRHDSGDWWDNHERSGPRWQGERW